MKHWHALYTKPGKEHQVSALLRQQGIRTFLPTVRRQVRRRDRSDRVVYFPCYLFARLDFERTRRSSITWMPGVRRIVSNGESPAIVPDEIVQLIHDRLEHVEGQGFYDLRRGDRVRITSGPLRDLDAVFDRPLRAVDRVRVLLDVMGRMAPVEIDRSHIARC